MESLTTILLHMFIYTKVLHFFTFKFIMNMFTNSKQVVILYFTFSFKTLLHASRAVKYIGRLYFKSNRLSFFLAPVFGFAWIRVDMPPNGLQIKLPG